MIVYQCIQKYHTLFIKINCTNGNNDLYLCRQLLYTARFVNRHVGSIFEYKSEIELR